MNRVIIYLILFVSIFLYLEAESSFSFEALNNCLGRCLTDSVTKF